MKKLLALALIGLFATAANAGVFYINQEAENVSISMDVSQTATLSLYYRALANESMTGAQVFFTQDSHNPGFEVIAADATGAPAGWFIDRTLGGMPNIGDGIPLAQRAGFLDGYVYSSLGTGVAGPAIITLDVLTLHGLAEVTDHPVKVWNDEWPQGHEYYDLDRRTEFLGSVGADPLDPWTLPFPEFTGFTRLINGGFDHPVLVTVVPEPASLALLAIGGLALIRRR